MTVALPGAATSSEPSYDVVWPLAPLAAGQHRMGEAVRNLNNVSLKALTVLEMAAP